jgi:hypothetical protein
VIFAAVYSRRYIRRAVYSAFESWQVFRHSNLYAKLPTVAIHVRITCAFSIHCLRAPCPGCPVRATCVRGGLILFQKTGKGFDALHVRDGQQMSRFSNRLKQMDQKNQKKTAIDSNERFADVEKITTAQRAIAAQQKRAK